MNNNLAIVTGGTSKIGKDIVKHLISQNWNVIIHYNTSHTDAQKLQNSLPSNTTFLIQQDFKKSFDEKEFFKEIESLTKQKPSLLINNASSFENDTLQTLDPDNFLQQIKVNCLAPILLGREFVKDNKDCNIINLLDFYAIENSKNFASHQISKASLLKATQQMAVDFAPSARVNGITLSFVIPDNNQNNKLFENRVQQSLLKSAVPIKDICSTIDFIIATKSITGKNIILDCGR